MITHTNNRQVPPDITVFEIAGRLSQGNTLISVEHAIRELIAQGVRKLAIDLKGLHAIDSAGLGTLLACNGAMEKAGGDLRVAGAHGPVANSFSLVHLDAVVKVDPDIETSLNHLGRS
jgi:anti-anti-sigma factor